jgi:hypothetical protein
LLTAGSGLHEDAVCSIIFDAVQYRTGVCECQAYLEEKRMGDFGSIGLTEILVILGICGLCLLPILVGGVAVVIALISRR